MAYCLLAELKAYLGDTSNTDDTVLQQLLDDAQASIEGPSGCGRLFQVTQDTTRYLDAVRDVDDYFLTVWLDEDLCAITSIVNGDGTTVTSSQYVTNPRNRTPYYSLQFRWSASSAWTFDTSPEVAIAITGRWGYSTTAPSDIHYAHKRLAAYYYRLRDAQTYDVTADLATGQMTIPKGVPVDIKPILDNYRRTTPE